MVSWRELRLKALIASEASGEETLYDCGKCAIDRSAKWRRKNGCRLLDPRAVSEAPIEILGVKNFLDFCPGIIVDSPFIYSIYEIERIVKSGLSLGNALELPCPVVDSLCMLGHARDLERAFRARIAKDKEAPYG